MIKNVRRRRWAIVVGASGGGVAFAATWYVLDRAGAGDPRPIVWAGVWLYGFAIGAGAALAYTAFGGRSTAGAAAAAGLGAFAVTCGVFAVLLAEEVGDQSLGDLLVGAVLVFLYWALPLSLVVLVVPAVATALVLAGTATLVQRLVTRGR